MTGPSSEPITLALAQSHHLEFYIDLLEGVAEWLHRRGLSPLPREIYRQSKTYYADSIARGEVYFGYVGELVVGSLRLVANDGIVWPLMADDDALYLENLVVIRAWNNHGFGRLMLAWAEGQAALAGKRRLRLDCFAGNAILRRYYEAAGYTGEGEVDARYPFGTLRLQRYEKTVQVVQQPGS